VLQYTYHGTEFNGKKCTGIATRIFFRSLLRLPSGNTPSILFLSELRRENKFGSAFHDRPNAGVDICFQHYPADDLLYLRDKVAGNKILQVKRPENAPNRAICMGAPDNFHHFDHRACIRLDGADDSIVNQQH